MTHRLFLVRDGDFSEATRDIHDYIDLPFPELPGPTESAGARARNLAPRSYFNGDTVRNCLYTATNNHAQVGDDCFLLLAFHCFLSFLGYTGNALLNLPLYHGVAPNRPTANSYYDVFLNLFGLALRSACFWKTAAFNTYPVDCSNGNVRLKPTANSYPVDCSNGNVRLNFLPTAALNCYRLPAVICYHPVAFHNGIAMNTYMSVFSYVRVSSRGRVHAKTERTRASSSAREAGLYSA